LEDADAGLAADAAAHLSALGGVVQGLQRALARSRAAVVAAEQRESAWIARVDAAEARAGAAEARADAMGARALAAEAAAAEDAAKAARERGAAATAATRLQAQEKPRTEGAHRRSALQPPPAQLALSAASPGAPSPYQQQVQEPLEAAARASAKKQPRLVPPALFNPSASGHITSPDENAAPRAAAFRGKNESKKRKLAAAADKPRSVLSMFMSRQ
jgi:hypothetical protein